MDVYYAHSPVPYSAEEDFEGCFHGCDDLTLAQLLQDQETVYQSLQRNARNYTTGSSNTTRRGGPDDRQQRRRNSSQTVNSEAQLSRDEAYARELQELENQLSYTYLDGTSGTGTDVTLAESSTSRSHANSARDASTRVTIEDDVDPDNMTYEVRFSSAKELQSLGEAIGTKSRGLSDELISYLPLSTFKTRLFQRRENHEECVICYMGYKNGDKLITLPCHHHYHQACVTKWLMINKACPVCNEKVFGS